MLAKTLGQRMVWLLKKLKNLRDVDHNIHSYDESGRGRAERIGRNTIARDGDARAKIWLRAYFNYII